MAKRFLVLALLAAAGCSHGEREVRDAVTRANRARLLADAAVLQRRFSFVVPESQWPPSFRAFKPASVHADPEGVFIETHETFVESAGLFIRLDPAYAPPRSGDPAFTEIEPDLYWYYAPG